MFVANRLKVSLKRQFPTFSICKTICDQIRLFHPSGVLLLLQVSSALLTVGLL